MATTNARVICNLKQEWGTDDKRYATLGFVADYANGANIEWAQWTPNLDLRMVVRGEVADRYEQGGHYSMTLDELLAPGGVTIPAVAPDHPA